MAQLPPRGLWRTKAGCATCRSVLAGPEVDPPTEDRSDPVGQALVRRYLAAFGPAASADLRAWCGLAGLPAAVSAIREELVTFRDERGRELLDLPECRAPTPTRPPRSGSCRRSTTRLGYHDRGRIVDDAHRGLSVAGARVVLVDGRVAATWNVEAGTVNVTPLRRFSSAERTAVAEQGRELASFLSDSESRRVRVAAAPG
ncbi:winged helix DNA-binding domain-containing protein [Streptomyces mirabilis]|nr:winged helix DNA-binding domain-containing protein [Streptomyces mirabilis]